MRKIGIIILVLAAICAGYVYYRSGVARMSEEQTPETPAWSLPEQASLPQAVTQTREAIAQAAHDKKYALLASLAGTQFTYSYGAGDDFQGFLEKSDSQYHHAILIPAILSAPYGSDGDMYYWPAAYRIDPKDWTETDIASLRAFNTDEQIAQYQQFNQYLGYRIGIKSDGSWLFYVAGD